jgi:hypothetical protein
MRNIDEHNITEAVVAGFSQCADPRLKRVMTSLVEHLHDFVRDVSLTESESEQAIGFLTATGHMCTGQRQEFILLSDTLGVSMLVTALNHRHPIGATEATVFGPFYVADAPQVPQGGHLAQMRQAKRCSRTSRSWTWEGCRLSMPRSMSGRRMTRGCTTCSNRPWGTPAEAGAHTCSGSRPRICHPG